MDGLCGGEYAFLLLTSSLGNSERKPLTVAQLRELFRRAEHLERKELHRDLEARDLVSAGYSLQMAQHIVDLLQDEEQVDWYVTRALTACIHPLTRASEGYSLLLRKRLGLDSPGVLWARGDVSLLERPAVSLVGSRELEPQNREFAIEVGRQAAHQGYVLVSGNARGADREAQHACLEAGGRVICVVADGLTDKKEEENVLYLSEDGFDLAFSAPRALSRNRVIHALGERVFVAQCGYQAGGTWSGTVKNLRFGWSEVYCFADGSPAQQLLVDMGAQAIGVEALADISALSTGQKSFWN